MLRITIVGAGIAGLAAAISLRRAGHVVHVYERSSMNNEVGAAITVPPNALRFLTAWGLDPVQWRFVKSRSITHLDPFSLETTAVITNEKNVSNLGGVDMYFAHRVDLHNSLKWMATREDGPGTPVVVHLKSEVVAFDPEAPAITLANGEVIPGDLIIGADGVHSIAVETVIGRKNKPVPSEHSNIAFRFLISAETLEEDPETRFFNEGRDGSLRLFPDNKTNRRMVCYPCRNNDILNFVGIINDEDMKYETKEDWLAGVDSSYVLEKFSGFNPKLLKVLSKATEVKRWPLLYRPPVPIWSKGRMTLVGDSAHPMLPHQGQGGAQGLEDGLALGLTLLGSSSSPQEIESRLAVYEKVRRGRASVIQILSNIGQDQSQLVREELIKHLQPDRIPNNSAEIIKYTYGYDVVRDTLREMKEHDPTFELPRDFFEGEVVGVPGLESIAVPYSKRQE